MKNGELRLEPCRKPSEDCITCQWFHVFNDGDACRQKGHGRTFICRGHRRGGAGPSVGIPDIVVLEN